MTTLLNRRVSIVWAVLVAITLVSWWMSVQFGVSDTRLAAVGLMILAYIKVRLIGQHFMELHHAPRILRSLFESWCIAACGGIAVLFVVT